MTDYHEGALQPDALSDAELLTRVRAGDQGAFDALFRRHAEAVCRYARGCCRDEHVADDLTAEVFARTLHALHRGAGPRSAVRAYLLTAVRHVGADWAASARRTQLVEDFADFAVQAVNPAGQVGLVGPGADVQAMRAAEQSLAVQAFRSLPERWQAALWHTEVEGESPREVAPLFGITPNAMAALAVRARAALKEAYLQAHVSAALSRDGECARYANRLGAYTRGGISRRAERGLRAHLDTCTVCHASVIELADINHGIPALVSVAVVGWMPSTDALGPFFPGMADPGR